MQPSNKVSFKNMQNKSNISNSSKKVTQKPIENMSQNEKKNNSFEDIQLHQEKHLQRSSGSDS